MIAWAWFAAGFVVAVVVVAGLALYVTLKWLSNLRIMP